MADGTTINLGQGGHIIDTEELPNGRRGQRVKLAIGAVDADDGDVSSSNPMPSQEARPSSSSVSSISGSASNQQFLMSNSSRKGATFYNDSTATLYLKLGTTASTSSYTVQLTPQSYYELPYPVYTGRIDGIWSSATGSALVTELT